MLCASSIISSALVLALDLDEGRQVGDVTVLAVDAFDDDQHPAVLVTDVGEQLVERGVVVVRERPARGAGELAALHDAVVREAVVDHQVAFAEQVPDHGDVGGVAADQSDRVLGAEQLRQLELQFAVDGLLAGEQARRRAGAAPSAHRVRHRLGHRGVARHAQVVVAGEVDHLGAVDDRGVAGDAVVDQEVGVLDADRLAEGEPVGQRLDLLELADPGLRGDCRRLRERPLLWPRVPARPPCAITSAIVVAGPNPPGRSSRRGSCG